MAFYNLFTVWEATRSIGWTWKKGRLVKYGFDPRATRSFRGARSSKDRRVQDETTTNDKIVILGIKRWQRCDGGALIKARHEVIRPSLLHNILFLVSSGSGEP